MPQPPAQPVLLPTLYPEREDDNTPPPPSPPSEVGQGGCRRLPISESWYTHPCPPPTAKEATETGTMGVSGLPDYNELLDLVQGGAGSQEVVAEQQREIIRYLGGLNNWLE
ncbi:hypothetical protein FRC06_011734 [Ceratobasidium sp. 370]|nr:hypothetical protein FRC06_011734 [Ceratobasidium sp. 370]